MNILIDIGHPAHVHIFKTLAHEMEGKGHRVLFTCRQKEFIVQLLEAEGFSYVSFGKKYTKTIQKLWGMVKFDFKMLSVSLRFHPDIFLSAGSMYAAQISWLLRKPHISIEDTYNMEQVRLYRPFTELILTGDYEHPLMSAKNEFRMAGYNELAYLHPKRFKPDETILKDLGVEAGEKYVLLRFVAWNATHDVGYKGMSLKNKIKAVKAFAAYGKVFISSEDPLPGELSGYRLPVEAHRIHDVIAHASLVFGESSTMSEEAAMLGVPAIYLNDAYIWYTRHLENDYKLMFNLSSSEEDQELAIKKALDLLSDPATPEKWSRRRQAMLAKRIDVSAFLIWLVENFPESKRIIMANPDYQFNFS